MIKKGENGFPVVFWKWIEVEDIDSVSGKKEVPFLRYYKVFNLEQTERIDIPETPTRGFNPIIRAEKVIHEMPNAPFIEHNESRAYYKPSQDVVNMPKANLFQSDEEYYSTIFHELTHSTGHQNRLNRDEISNISLFGSHDYSKEELVAEMGSAYLCGHCGTDLAEVRNNQINKIIFALKTHQQLIQYPSIFVLTRLRRYLSPYEMVMWIPLPSG
jgi:antirestriction protein ArdC